MSGLGDKILYLVTHIRNQKEFYEGGSQNYAKFTKKTLLNESSPERKKFKGAMLIFYFSYRKCL